MKKYLITSALLYANGPLHFGHIAGAYLPADIYARFKRMEGADVLYLSGSDEYGVPITLSAELKGRSPKQHVDEFHQINFDLFQKLDFSFDHFARTTWQGHDATVQEFFLDLHKNGFIEEKVEDHLYSEKEDRFMADRYVVGTCPKCGFEDARGDECQKCGASYEAKDLKTPRSKLTNSTLSLKKSKHWYLKFDAFQEKLTHWIEKKNWKENVVKFAKGYIENLHPRAITRDSKWGVPLPIKDTEGKVFYVWFDAPIGYISAAKEWAEKIGKPESWKDYWFDEKTTLIHFIGKDNIPFHAVFFPAMTMGQNRPYKLVDQIPANEFLMLEGKQFSKSDNWTIDLDQFFNSYSSDVIRYTLAANAPETSDSDFSWKDFQMRVNTELVGKLGNFIHRTFIFCQKNCEGKIPPLPEIKERDLTFRKEMHAKIEEFQFALNSFSCRKACQHLIELATIGNVYFDLKKPWASAKQEKFDDLYITIHLSLECIKNLALLAYPIMPSFAKKVWLMLGLGDISTVNLKKALEKGLQSNTVLEKSEPLFQKIEDEAIDAEIQKLMTPQS